MNFAKKHNFFVILVYLTVSIQLSFCYSICKHPETIIHGDAKVICAGECIFYCIPDYYFGEANDWTSNCTFSSVATTNESKNITNPKNLKHALGIMSMEMSTCNLSTTSVLAATKNLNIGIHSLKLNGAKFTASDSIIGFESITHLYLTNMPANGVLDEKCFRNVLDLKYLEISNNYNIDTLPANIFINQIELNTLNLTANNLRSLPNGIFKYTKKLILLDLSNNQLETIHSGTFDHLIDLEGLDLSYNKLNFDHFDDLHSPFPNLTKLKSLNLAENNLKLLSNTTFNNMHKLQVLDLSGNQLEYIESDLLNDLINLKHLNLNSNKISTFPDCIWRFNDRIYELDLSKNRLETMNAKDLQRLNQKREFKLDENPWKCECDSEFNKFLRTQQRLGYLKNVKCVNNLTIIDKLEICEQIEKYERLKIIIFSLVCGFGLFIIVVVVAVCYKNKNKSKTRPKNHNFR